MLVVAGDPRQVIGRYDAERVGGQPRPAETIRQQDKRAEMLVRFVFERDRADDPAGEVEFSQHAAARVPAGDPHRVVGADQRWVRMAVSPVLPHHRPRQVERGQHCAGQLVAVI